MCVWVCMWVCWLLCSRIFRGQLWRVDASKRKIRRRKEDCLFSLPLTLPFFRTVCVFFSAGIKQCVGGLPDSGFYTCYESKGDFELLGCLVLNENLYSWMKHAIQEGALSLNLFFLYPPAPCPDIWYLPPQLQHTNQFMLEKLYNLIIQYWILWILKLC